MRAPTIAFWQRTSAWTPTVLLIVGVLGMLSALAALARLATDNRIIERLGSGHDIAISNAASAAVAFARAKFLLDHDELEQAQPIAERVVHTGTVGQGADVLYDAGNARLRQAIAKIGDGKFDSAAADVVLARDFYERALRMQPGFWDAKYNLDIAMRLVRDFPATEIPGEELEKPTNKLWTDLPGLPKGGP
jgi:mxaK protein